MYTTEFLDISFCVYINPGHATIVYHLTMYFRL